MGDREPKLDNVRKLKRIHLIDPTDAEFKETSQNAREKFEIPMEAVIPCKVRRAKHGETCSSFGTRKTKYVCEKAFGKNSTKKIMKMILQEKE